MLLGWLLLIATLGSSVWVFFDAPRRGLSRAWSLGCLFVWVAFFPTYLIERAEADRSPADGAAGGHARRRLSGWFSRSRILMHRPAAAFALVVALPLTLVGLWQMRLLFRGPYMLFVVRHPALISIPLLAGATIFLVHLSFKLAKRALGGRTPPEPRRRSRKGKVREGVPDERARRRPRYSLAEFVRGGWRGRGERKPPLLFGPAMSFLVCGTLGFVFAVMVTASWTGAAIYEHSDYGPLTLEMLRGGQARIKPYEVARRQSQNGLNSPTERPTNLHIVKVDGDLLWTSVRDPDGFFRVLSKPTRGVMSVEASSTAPGVRQSGVRYDSDFRYGPGMRISENIRWQVYKKKCYSCDVAEMTGVPTPAGPLVIAPYIRYKGNWFVRRPTLGGVYVVHPDGRIDDLSPEQAVRSSLVRESGRLFPERLARRIADAYKFKRGIWNRLFVHTDQLEVADTEKNRQPFLQDFGRLGPQWVTTLKPRGRTFTTAGVITTDAVSGKTRVWLARRGQSLIGNQRALDIVRGESFPGIVFADASDSGGSGKFRVVEPRQVFPGGRLQFLLSIIPDAANRVTMSVVVDAASQRVTAKFLATPEGDADLIAYLRTGRLPGDAEREIAVPQGGRRTAKGNDPASTLRRLLHDNRTEQRRAARRISDLEAQERDLLRLLDAARKER
ncbi:MAG: DUF2834 domain-containing protein [Actinobacteria bacterium]|nr:DUF2834 domain-containing protein [Actinomycetota bacterium]